MTRAQYDALTGNSTCDTNGNCPATLINGGNPNLQPERGRSYTAGVVIQPTSIPGFSATVDWYNIAISGAFEWSRWGLAFDQCYNQKIDFWCNVYKRDPQTGRVTEIDARYSNSGRTDSQGFDVSLGYNVDPRRLGIAENAGTFAINFSGTLATKLTRQFAPNTPTWECNGYHGFNCGEPSPKWRHVAGINWALPWVKGGIGFTWRYTGSTKISKLSKDTTLAARPTATSPDTYPLIARLPAYNYFDFAANVAVNQYLDLRFNAQNLFDKDPPLIGDGQFGGVGQYQNTYSSYYTIRGRTLRVGLTARF
jgi:outer membrane receptor protein involved in Fe transport